MDVRPTLLIATTNAGKLREVRGILGEMAATYATLSDHSGLPEAVEDQDTFEGNAQAKALHYSRLTGGLTLADDSGLMVDALGGEPGVWSARYAGPCTDDTANNAKLIANLADVPVERRTARFCCAIALATPEGVLATAEGTIEGRIVDEARGSNGFGYDPHFFIPEEGQTAAELSPERKNRISHRGRALRAIRPHVERYLADAPGPRQGG